MIPPRAKCSDATAKGGQNRVIIARTRQNQQPADRPSRQPCVETAPFVAAWATARNDYRHSRNRVHLMRRKSTSEDALAVFPTALGWMAVVAYGNAVRRLVLGYDSPEEAVAALGEAARDNASVKSVDRRLIARLKAYARRGADDFRDVRVDLGPLTEFQHRVITACRRIPCGATSSYGELATAAGYPCAARAVGSVMAKNRVPLIIPCHRVLASAGKLGGYSSRHGLAMKSRLLELEASGRQPATANRARRPCAVKSK